jgi:hypothetical protein
MEDSSMKKHVTLVAALQIGFSTMGIIAGIILFFVFSFAQSVIQDVEIAGPLIKFIGTVLPGMMLITSLLGLIGGIGLLTFQKWSRILVMVIAALICFVFPIGTVIGIYSLWVMMQDETIKMFR